MIDPSVTKHLSKYFELARNHFEDGDYPLATFFAITLIEECAKILILRDADLKNKAERHRAVDHGGKQWTALVNLLSSSEDYDALPKQWQDEAWSLFGLNGNEATHLRNNSLYLQFDTRGRLKAPNKIITSDRAALIVYLAGFVAVELKEYVNLDPIWVDSVLERAEDFKTKHLKG